MKQYELFQENVINIENQDRFVSNEKTPILWSRCPLERHAAKNFTRGIYLKMLTEFVNATTFGVIEIEKDKLYDLKRISVMNIQNSVGSCSELLLIGRHQRLNVSMGSLKEMESCVVIS